MFDGLIQAWTLFPNALAAALLIAVVCSALGVFVLLKRVVFIGITLSEIAALGIALSMAWELPPILGAGILTLASVTLLAIPLESVRLPKDAVMGMVFVLASGLAVLVVAQSGFGLHEVKTLLYGDIILTSPSDLAVMAAVFLPVLAVFLLFLRPILYCSLDRDAARVMGMRVMFWELAYFYCLGLAVSSASKTAGALLVFCYLVVPPAAGFLLMKRLIPLMLVSAGFAVVATLFGITWSLNHDLPANQTIAVAACVLLFGVFLVRSGKYWLIRIRNDAREKTISTMTGS